MGRWDLHYNIHTSRLPLVCACRSESVHTILVCLAAHTLYDEGSKKTDLSASPSAVRASTGSLREQDDSNGEAQIGGPDQDDDAASFRTAEGNSDEAAALGNQVVHHPHSCCMHIVDGFSAHSPLHDQ